MEVSSRARCNSCPPIRPPLKFSLSRQTLGNGEDICLADGKHKNEYIYLLATERGLDALSDNWHTLALSRALQYKSGDLMSGAPVFLSIKPGSSRSPPRKASHATS